MQRKKYQPLVLQKLDIHVPGIHVRQFALHRHLPETTDVKLHSHRFSQCLLYLSGRGDQEISEHSHPVETGTAVFMPPGVRHAFHREANRRPICLVIDFDWHDGKSKPACVLPLPTGRLHEVRQLLARLASQQRTGPSSSSIQISVIVLKVLDCLLAGTALQRASQASFESPVARKLDRLLTAPATASEPLGRLASLAGYQQDYLNRLLKQHEGLTFGQLRARKRLTRAQQLLRRAGSVAEVADAVGFNDPNYFARWFRKHTGLPPSRWRVSREGPVPLGA